MSAIVTSEDSFDKSIKTETVQSFNKSKKSSKLEMETQERRQLVFLLLTLNIVHSFFERFYC